MFIDLFRKGVSSIYILLITAALLPLVMFLGVSLNMSLYKEQQILENGLLSKTKIVSNLIDSELQEQIRQTKVYSSLPLFDPPIDISFIASRVERVEKHEPLWLSVSIFDSHLERVYSSKHLPQATAFEPDSIREAFFTQKPTIGSISQGPNGWGIPIRVPVIREGVVVYVLSVIIGTDELSNLLADVNIPEHWFGVVADKDGLIVARNHNIDQTIGKYLSKPSLDARGRGGSGIYYGQNLEGIPIISAYQISSKTGWSVHFGVPLVIYQQPMAELKRVIVVGILLTSLLTMAFVMLLLKEIKRRQTQLTLLEQKNRLESLGELTGRVAHDFNNLLFVIMANLDLIDKTPSSSPKDRLTAIRVAAERGARITKDLLAFSRGGNAEPKVIELNEHIRNLIMTVRERFSPNVEIVFDLNESPLFVEVDDVQLDLAILNMIVNSCQAMPHAGGCVKIITRKDGNCVSMTIADDGHGISDAIIQRVFEPFFTTKGENGNGFGLSQVYGFVKQANGTVSIESNKTGTAVRIDLPSGPKSSSGASERLTMAAGRGLQERREYR